MRAKIIIPFVTALLTITMTTPMTADVATLPQLREMTARFAPAPLRVDTSMLSPGDKKALVKLIEAARVVNHIFLQQVWNGNVDLLDKL
ncbi:MAG TPA: hypothetical protein VHC72_12750, partial [Bryobacteraceae bacterium]|nr:hypothetical protein [Bryobacteraceae bacterium]